MLWKNECVSEENTERTAIYYGLLLKNSTLEKKVYFIIVFHPVFYVLYMSIIVYSFDKLAFDNKAFFCF